MSFFIRSKNATEFSQQLERERKSDRVPVSPNALDEKILAYARQRVPVQEKQSVMIKPWMSAVSAFCIVTMVTLFVYRLPPSGFNEGGFNEGVFDESGFDESELDGSGLNENGLHESKRNGNELPRSAEAAVLSADAINGVLSTGLDRRLQQGSQMREVEAYRVDPQAKHRLAAPSTQQLVSGKGTAAVAIAEALDTAGEGNVEAIVEANIEANIEVMGMDATESVSTDIKSTNIKATDIKATDIKATDINATDEISEQRFMETIIPAATRKAEINMATSPAALTRYRGADQPLVEHILPAKVDEILANLNRLVQQGDSSQASERYQALVKACQCGLPETLTLALAAMDRRTAVQPQ